MKNKRFNIFKRKKVNIDEVSEYGCGYCGYFELPIKNGKEYSKLFSSKLVDEIAGCTKMDECPLGKHGGIEYWKNKK